MAILRNRLAASRAGGPRQFSQIRDMFIITSQNEDSQRDLQADLDKYELEGRRMSHAPVTIAEPRDRLDSVLEKLSGNGPLANEAKDAIEDLPEETDGFIDVTTSLMSSTQELLASISEIPSARTATFAYTYADYGPENLRMSPFEMDSLDEDEAKDKSETLEDVNERLGVKDAWSETTGENAIVAIFDTGFAEDLISKDRVVETYHGNDVDSVYRGVEGHGTMCAGAAVANKEDGVPYNGIAPDADVILVRTTDEEGQIRSDYITEAWDWITGLDYDRPIVTNHSYGTPLCTGRPRSKYCQTPEADMIRVANSDSNITSVYAAGNEAMNCGHRPSGITNAITGQNSLSEVITVGALRFDERDAQRYSSHGRGDCAPISDPKPNVSCILPRYTYYGTSDGYEIKDMGVGVGGSSGGTSHASPSVAGMIALIQSKAMEERGEPLQTEEVKQIIHESASPPRRTQINIFDGFVGQDGYDARFGHGQIDISKALDEV